MKGWQRKPPLLFSLGLTVLLAGAIASSRVAEGAAKKGRKAQPFKGWKPGLGNWRVKGDVYVQTDGRADCRSFAEPATWQDYIYEVKARKKGGGEGFLILFRVEDHQHFYWWNIAGWGNTRHAIETRPRRRGFPSQPGRVETNRWYDIKIVVEGPSIKCYLDGKLIHNVKDNTYKAGGIGLGSWSTQVEYKDVSVTTLDGRKLYGADKMEMTAAALEDIGQAGRALRQEYDTLRKAGAPPDDRRWQALYQKVAKLRDRIRGARESLDRIDLEAPRAALERIIEECPKEKARAAKLLKRLSGHEERLKDMKRAAAMGKEPDVRGVEEIVAFVKEVTDLERSMYPRRCPPVAFIKRQAGGRRGTNATMLAQMTGIGSAICTYDPAHLEKGARTIFEDKEGFIFDMSPSYDTRKLLFAYKKKVRERKDSFHIYEINLDGSGLRQLTSGRYHDVSPVYLPDGRIVFNSTRVESFSVCQNFLAAALYIMNGDGSGLRRLEYNTLCDVTPFVLDDGSILFSRWEYQDKNIFCTQALWTINPDGTRVQLFYGNTLTIPNSIYGAKQIPGTRRVVCTMAAHHHPPLGAIGLIDRTLGHENVEGIVNITPEVPYTPTVGRHWRDTNWGPGDKLYRWSYTDPWPIAEDLFLVSYGGPMQGGPQRYRLYLLDDKSNKVLLYEDPTTSCFNPVPLRPRPLPHRFPGAIPPPQGEGRYFVLDVYQGLLQAGVRRGQVTHLRIMAQIKKKYNTEGPRYSDHYPAIGEGTYYVKYNYGTVPVYEDGSAYFIAPAGVELYFQALDANGKEIRRMGTVTQITAGETQGCIGCHESRSTTPPVGAVALQLLAKGPGRITPPPWGAGPVDFVKQVQPVLDKYCVKCHSGPDPKKGVDLSGDKTRLFNMAFETLVFRPGLVARYHINPGPTGNFPPLQSGSYVSKLTRMIEEGHSKVKMDAESRRRIYTWIDANVPYYGTWDMTRPHTFGGRDTWLGLRNRPLPWFAEFRKAYAASTRRGKGADLIKRGRRERIANVRHTDINLTHPEWSRVLQRNLAKSAGGLADDKRALFKSKDDPRYQAVLKAIEKGKAALLAKPRVDMPGAVPLPQERDFGRTF